MNSAALLSAMIGAIVGGVIVGAVPAICGAVKQKIGLAIGGFFKTPKKQEENIDFPSINNF